MSGLTMLRLLLLMYFVLLTKCDDAHGTQLEEDFGGFYDMTTSTRTVGTSWRDLRPNITPTVNAEGVREEKDFFDNGDRHPDLLTSVEPDGNSSIIDDDYASNEYVTTYSNDLLTTKGSLLTVKWDAADAEQQNYFENVQLNNLTTSIISVTDISSNEKENIDSVESIFADSVDNITNLSSEEVSTIVDVDQIFFNSDDDHFSAVTSSDFSTVNSMDFHDIFVSEQTDNYTGDNTKENNLDNFTVEESSGYEPLTTLVTMKDYLSGTLTNAPLFFDASDSVNQFENLEESSGDEPSTTESKTFADTYSLSTTFNGVANWIQTEKTVSGKDEKVSFSEDEFETWRTANGFEDDVKNTHLFSSKNNDESSELGKFLNENEDRMKNVVNHEAVSLERTLFSQSGLENFKGENEDVFASQVDIEDPPKANLDFETTTIGDYKSTIQSETEMFGLESTLQNNSEEPKEGNFTEMKSFTEQFNVPENETETTSVHYSGTYTDGLELNGYEEFQGEQSTEIKPPMEEFNALKEEIEVTTVFYSEFHTENPDKTPTTSENDVNTETLKKTGEFEKMDQIFVEDSRNNAGEEEFTNEDETVTSKYSTVKEETSTTPKIEVHSENMEGNFNESGKTHEIILENNKENEQVSSGERPFAFMENDLETTTILSFVTDNIHKYTFGSNSVTVSKFEVQSENVEYFEATSKTSLGSEPEKLKDVKDNIGSSGDGPITYMEFDGEKSTETVTTFVTDSDLSTATEVRADVLETSTETNLEDKTHRVSKKLIHFEQISENTFENSMNVEEIQKDILDDSWTTPEKFPVKTDSPELEFQGEYVYTDIDISKAFDSIANQNFLEYGGDDEETESVSSVEDSLVTEQNQIEQTFTEEMFLPGGVKTEEKNKSLEILNEKNFRDVTTDVEDTFTSTTEGDLNFIQESERTTETQIVETKEKQSLTAANVEETKMEGNKLENDFDEALKSTESIDFAFNLDFSDVKTISSQTFSPTTEIFEEHSHFSQEDESTTALIINTETQQPLDVNDVNPEEGETTTSKLENDSEEFSYKGNLFIHFKENLSFLKKSNSDAIAGDAEEENLYDKHLTLWIIPAEAITNSNEMETIETLEDTTAKEIKNDQEYTQVTQNAVDLTTLEINENFMSREKETDNQDTMDEGLMESTTERDTTISFQERNTDVMRGANFIRNENDTSEFITEKSTEFSVLHETEDEISGNASKNKKFESEEEKLTESTSQSILKDLTTLKANQDFTFHKIWTNIDSTNEELTEYTSTRYTTSSFDKLNTEATEEDINFSRNEEITTEKSIVGLSYENEDARLDSTVESVSDELTEDLTEKAIHPLEEAETETNTVRFSLKLLNDYSKNSKEEVNVMTETSKFEVPLDLDLTTSSMIDESETPTVERDFVLKTQTESLESDLQSWKESEEEKKVPTLEDILYYSTPTTTSTPVTLSKETGKYYFTEETFSAADEKEFAVNDVELHLQQNTEVTEDALTTGSTNKQVFTNSGDGLQEEIEIEDNIKINATEAQQINTTPFDSTEESTSEETFSESTSTIRPGNWELDKNTMNSEFETEVNLETTAVFDNTRKETVEEYLSTEIKRKEGRFTTNASEIEDQEYKNVVSKKTEAQITSEMTTTTDEENMTTSSTPDYSLENQDNLRKKVFTLLVETESYLTTTTMINKQKQEFSEEEFNKEMLSTVSSAPYNFDLNLKDSNSINEKEDKSTSARLTIKIEHTTEVINSVREETSEELSTVTPQENSTMTKTEFNLNNSRENTPRFETRNTVEEEQEVTEEMTTSNIKLFNKVEVETNGRFLRPQFHLDETSPNEEENNNFRKESRLGQAGKKRNENVQLDSPAVETATEKQHLIENTAPSTNHQGLTILNKSRKIFGEMSKKIFQKYIDVTTTEENLLYKGEFATKRNSNAVEESEEDDEMIDDDRIQINGFIRKINNHRNLQNVNRTSVNLTETSRDSTSDWEIVFDYRHHTNADLSEVIVTQKRDVIVRESVDGSQSKLGGNFDEPHLNLNLCDPWIEAKNRSCLTLGSLHINFMFDNFTTYILPTANVSGSCNDKNHVIDVNWVVDGTSNGVLSLQLHVGEMYYWINSVYFLLNLPDKRHTQISVNDLVILETQVGDLLQGTINISSTSGLQLSIRIVDLTSTKIDNCIPREDKVFLEHELALIVGGAALAIVFVLTVVVFLLYKKFRTTTSAYKMAIE